MKKLGITASQTVGPFLKIGLAKGDMEYLVPKNTNGAIKICGHVYDGQQEVVPDAMIEIWQANIYGKYAHPEDTSEAELVNGFNGFGRSCTDHEGYFFFYTVKPGCVPGRGNSLQAPHILLNIFARGMLKQQVTRIYFEDEIEANFKDPILNSIDDKDMRETLFGIKAPTENGLPVYKFDIYLQGEKETVFFEV